MTSAGSWLRQRRILEVRSATQPLGSTAPLDPARLSERLRVVNAGQSRMESGSRQLQKGLNEGAAKLRAALWLEERTGIPLTGTSDTTRAALASNLGTGMDCPAGRTWHLAQTGERRAVERPAQRACSTS